MGKHRHNAEANEWRGKSHKRGNTGKDWTITVRRARDVANRRADQQEPIDAWHAMGYNDVERCPLVEVVAGCLRSRDLCLFARRSGDREFVGCWEFPGGKVEPGELPEDTLVREWREEFCLDIFVGRYLGIWEGEISGRMVRVRLFEVFLVSQRIDDPTFGEVDLSVEVFVYEKILMDSHDQIRWSSLSYFAAAQPESTPSTLPLVQQAIQAFGELR